MMASLISSSSEKPETIQLETVAQTKPDRLITRYLDMRSTRIDEFIDEDLSSIRLFNILLFFDGKIYSVCMNDHVKLMDLTLELIAHNILTKNDAELCGLYTAHDDEVPLAFTHRFSKMDHDHRFYLKPKPKPKPLLSDTWVSIIRCNGQNFKVGVDLESETVATLNRRIQIEHGICADEYLLIFNGKSLESTSKLLDYGIGNTDKIYLMRRMRKPVIRLRSNHGEIIDNVNLSIELDPNIWQLSSVYPEPSITNKISFVQWNHMQVHGDGKIIFKSDSNNGIDRFYPSINDEQEHRMLFWEAFTKGTAWNKAQEHSLCVPRDDFARILNYALKRMGFSSEDRDDLLTFVLPQLDEADPIRTQKKVVFSFLSPDFYSTAARLIVRPPPQQIIRVYMIFGFGKNEQNISKLDELNNAIDRTITSGNSTNSGLVVHEWGTMFIN